MHPSPTFSLNACRRGTAPSAACVWLPADATNAEGGWNISLQRSRRGLQSRHPDPIRENVGISCSRCTCMPRSGAAIRRLVPHASPSGPRPVAGVRCAHSLRPAGAVGPLRIALGSPARAAVARRRELQWCAVSCCSRCTCARRRTPACLAALGGGGVPDSGGVCCKHHWFQSSPKLMNCGQQRSIY